MSQLARAAKDSLAEAAVINAINVPVALVVSYLIDIGAVPVFGFILLLEATGLMFIGGAMDLSMSAGSAGLAKLLKQKGDPSSDSEEIKRKRLQRAIVFALAGALLFVESLALALPYV